MAKNDDWLTSRLTYIRGLKSPSAHQRLLLLLVEQPQRTAEDERKLSALVKAERAAERALQARALAARVVDKDKEAARKARDHELYNAAGLLILAGLVDTKTGLPTGDRGELLGALLGLAQVPADDPRRGDWKRAGEALLSTRLKNATVTISGQELS
jgi:hypothetical protein